MSGQSELLNERALTAAQATVALSGVKCEHPRHGLIYKYSTAGLGVMFRDWLECPSCGAQFSLVDRKWSDKPNGDQPRAEDATP